MVIKVLLSKDLHRGSYMSAPVFIDLLNKMRKSDEI